ncbi:MAG: hypothetical protein HWD59_04060 [Coxiellaceae bacterium]|nr:MAG: hypothetical protein HWD59_04060 [Coxiellaceae bacterium]
MGKTDTNVIVLEDVLMNPEAYPLTGKIPLSAQAMKNSDEDLNKQCNLKRNSIIKELLESTKKQRTVSLKIQKTILLMQIYQCQHP